MKKRSLFSLVLVAGLALAGCGGGQSSTGGGSAASGKGNVLTVAQNADAVTLDPHKTNDHSSANVTEQIYNTLVDLTPDIKIKPSLAESWKQVNDTTWEFKLRKGVKFHNGEELKASDVKFTFDRLLDKKTAAPGAFVLNPVKETKVVDDYTVQIITNQPFAPILYNLTHVATSILNEKAVKEGGDNYGLHPVGTGPFKFVKWDKNSQIELAKNNDYFEGPAKLDKIVYRIIPESATALAEIRTGGVDMVMELPPEQVKQLESGQDVKVDKAPGFAVKYLSFDTREKPFNDPRVRQAINYAINKDEVVKGAYSGLATVANGPLSPAVNGAKKDLPGYGNDLEKAKQLLAEAGYPNGFESTLYLSNADLDKKIATITQAQLGKIGIKLNQQVMEWGAFLDKTGKGVPMFILSWITVTGDADNGMYALFHSKNFGGPGNRSFYKNEEVDKLLDAGQSETNPEKRQQDYFKAQELIVKDAPWAFLTVGQNVVGLNKRVQGFINMPTQTYKFYPVSVQ